MSRQQLIDVALGDAPADVIVEGGRLVNVWTNEIHDADVAIRAGRVAAIGDVAYTKGDATRSIDAGGRFLTPGLLEGHLHQYHSYLGINAFAEAMLSHGVTCTADGFYGPGIIAGLDAVKFFKDAFEQLPMRLIFLVGTAAWLQNRDLGLTPTPQGIAFEDMLEMLSWEDCYGLEEPQPFPVLKQLPEYVTLLEECLRRRKVISGHASGLSHREIQAYVAAGAALDHESDSREDALFKARVGMGLLGREGSGCRDLSEVVRAYTEHGVDTQMFGFSSDVASAEKLRDEGTTDEAIRVAIHHGVPPVDAVRMGTLNTARFFHAEQDLGSIAPGRYADIVLVEDLVEFSIDAVLVGGEHVVKDGRYVAEIPPVQYPPSFYGTVRLPAPVTAEDLTFATPEHADGAELEVRVIGVTDGTLVTDERRVTLPVIDGALHPRVADDVLLLAMIDRFGKGTGIGLGFAQGFGLQAGAFASTANAQCENIVIVGTNPHDMAIAANHVTQVGGGKAVVRDGEVIGEVGLPLLGLHAEGTLDDVMREFDAALAAIAQLGCKLASPFSQLEFSFACGALGDIKLSEEALLLIHPPERIPVVVGSVAAAAEVTA
ncbi:MAG TPA: adenine deaminase C-terminal domain-containing protein [Conexibacter sp.]|nr:adenine deaminase C-terminal domain-containing protein [Conexibacter sp.]